MPGIIGPVGGRILPPRATPYSDASQQRPLDYYPMDQHAVWREENARRRDTVAGMKRPPRELFGE
jgi:hypothetical protein